LKDKIRPGAKRLCVSVVGGGGIRIVPFWDVDFSGTGGGGGDSVGENAVDEEFLFTRAGKGKGVLVIDEKRYINDGEETT
jgi:hypothetical protein